MLELVCRTSKLIDLFLESLFEKEERSGRCVQIQVDLMTTFFWLVLSVSMGISHAAHQSTTSRSNMTSEVTSSD